MSNTNIDPIPIPPEVQQQIDAARAALAAHKQKAECPADKQPRQARDTDKGNVNRTRWAMLNRFVDCQMRTLPSQAAACWLVLFRHADGSGRVARSQSMLAHDTGLSEWSIRKGVKALEKSGLLCVERKGNNVNGTYTTTCYKLQKQ